jgi:hypothetical protein
MFHGSRQPNTGPARMRRLILAGLLASVLVAVGSNPARAFPGTDDIVWHGVTLPAGKIAETHQHITTESIQGLERRVFGDSASTPQMQTALGRIVAANAAVDEDQTRSLLHFDGETFPEGQARLIALAASVKKDLADQDPIAAQADLGSALHTLQDFYSHSNWVELGNTFPNPDLGRAGHTLTRLSADVQTCDGSKLITDQLTSGYGGEKDRVASPGKCHHGGLLEAPHLSGINKDTELAVLSPHHKYHAEAARLAVLATTQYLEDIRSSLPSADQFALLLGQSRILTASTSGTIEDCDYSANVNWVNSTDRLSGDVEIRNMGKIRLCVMAVVVSFYDLQNSQLGTLAIEVPQACGRWIPLCSHEAKATIGALGPVAQSAWPTVDHINVKVLKLED